ncbi:MAG: glycosyl transferase, family 51, partial [Frankiales bacterium]|nr:glycosyl transferase, family 51 [Frankiales bacterium]
MSRLWNRVRQLPWKKILLIGPPTFVLLLVGVFAIVYWRTTIPEPSSFSLESSTVVRYDDGSDLARLGTNRTIVPLSEISEPAQKAVLAAEDRGFYTEPGISPKGIGRALFTNVRGGGGVQQGGSTITQQYAKNAFLTQERTYTRKVKEVFISLKMTRQRSKEQILQDYLNTIYFGRGAYGIDAASKAYFGPTATAASLTPAQGAVLASSIRSPSGYDPTKHLEKAQARFTYVLDGMVSEGWLTPEARQAAAYPAVVPPAGSSGGTDLSGPSGTVVDRVMQEIADSGVLTEAEVAQGGLDITTTLRRGSQEAAIAAVQRVTTADRSGTGLQGALVAVEPKTGKVVAYYGGANGTGLDYADTPLQAGSSFKPYTLATALSQGISLDTRYDGASPQTFTEADGTKTKISNFESGDPGRVDLITATEDSVNTAYYALAEQVGPDKIAELAHRAGIPASNPLSDHGRRTAQITLGAYPVRVIDQATGFATFAAGGTSATPYLVAKVSRGKTTLFEGRTQNQTAFSPEVAADATVAMQAVVTSGSGTRAKLADGRPAAGKTGTTSENKQIWFAGFTPQLAAAVYFGYGTPQTIKIDGVNQVTGGRIAAAAWKEFMDGAMAGLPKQPFPPRANVGKPQQPSPAPRTAAPVTSAPPTVAPTVAPTVGPTVDVPATPTPSPSASP